MARPHRLPRQVRPRGHGARELPRQGLRAAAAVAAVTIYYYATLEGGMSRMGDSGVFYRSRIMTLHGKASLDETVGVLGFEEQAGLFIHWDNTESRERRRIVARCRLAHLHIRAVNMHITKLRC